MFDSIVRSSDSEFDEILGTYESRQKKDKSYQTFKKERRDRKGRTVIPSKGNFSFKKFNILS